MPGTVLANLHQHLEVDPANLTFLFQGVSDKNRAGKKYWDIPWELGLLKAR